MIVTVIIETVRYHTWYQVPVQYCSKTQGGPPHRTNTQDNTAGRTRLVNGSYICADLVVSVYELWAITSLLRRYEPRIERAKLSL